jgi:hypothetical protein
MGRTKRTFDFIRSPFNFKLFVKEER